MLTEAFILCLSLLAVTGENDENPEGKHWGLIVAGSNEWYNYRHQADACHAYQILSRNGIPDENIVVMMYDDIAHNKMNPTPGVIINKPHGEDVYHGVPKDYTRREVNPVNFLNILKGDKKAMQGIGSGKVIDSGPNDHVFVFFTDHGAPGLIAFPYSELHAHDLMEAIDYMYENRKFSRMVFYLEACESGSMFKYLRKNINVFATTAANATQSSYACYYSKKYKTYLGDVYSVKWMENSDKVDLSKETLLQQYEIVKRETNTSQVRKFGDMSFDSDDLGDFQGEESDVQAKGVSGITPEEFRGEPITDAVPAPDVQLSILHNQLRDAETVTEKRKTVKDIQELLKKKEGIRNTVEQIVNQCVASGEQKVRVLKSHADPMAEDSVCYKKAVSTFSKNCYNLGQNEHALRYMGALSNMCGEKIPTRRIVSAIERQCSKYGRREIQV